MYGIDVSDNNGKMNVGAFKVNGAAPQFLIAKASEGTNEIDPDYGYYRSQASSLKIPFGAFHYYLNGGVAEAEHFVSAMGHSNGLGMWLDYENPTGNWAADAKGMAAFVAKVKSETGVSPGLYIDISNMNEISKYTSEMKFSSLWLTAPSYPVGDPNLPYKCSVHQYSISGNVDLDYSNWTSSTWYSFWTA